MRPPRHRGLLSLLLSKRPILHRSSLPHVAEKLTIELEALREQFVFSGWSALKSEGARVIGLSPLLEKEVSLIPR